MTKFKFQELENLPFESILNTKNYYQAKIYIEMHDLKLDSDYEEMLRIIFDIIKKNKHEITSIKLDPLLLRNSLESELSQLIFKKIKIEFYARSMERDEKEDREDSLNEKKDDLLNFIYHKYINYYERKNNNLK